jgi:hypothetical protein
LNAGCGDVLYDPALVKQEGQQDLNVHRNCNMAMFTGNTFDVRAKEN